MSQSTDELTRSELRAIRGHYRRRVWLAFLIRHLLLSRLAGCCSRTRRPARCAVPGSAPDHRQWPDHQGGRLRELCGRPPGSKHDVGSGRPGAQGLAAACQGPRRLPGGQIGLAEARRRWDQTTKVGWPAPTGSTSKPRSTRRPPPPANSPPSPRWIASISWRAVTLTASPALLQETPPDSFVRPLVLCCSPNSRHRPQFLPPHPGR
jgi:hypothetical protein